MSAPDCTRNGGRAIQQQGEQPGAKNRLSRLQHMSVRRPAKCNESPLKQALFKEIANASKETASRDQEYEDQLDHDISSPSAAVHTNADADSPAGSQPSARQADHAGGSVRPYKSAHIGDTAVLAEGPILSQEKAAAQSPAGAISTSSQSVAHQQAVPAAPAAHASSPATQGPAPKTAQSPVMPNDNLNPKNVANMDDSDDEWEDQPMPTMHEGSAEPDQPSTAAAPFTGGEGWTSAAEAAVEQSDSASVSSSQQGGRASCGNILMDDADTANATTQRLLRETASTEGLGKGFKPQVAPLHSILEKLASRQAALEAKARQRAPAVTATEQPPLTMQQLKAHLEQHSLVSRQQQPQQQQHGADMTEAQSPEAASTAAAVPLKAHSPDNLEGLDDIHDGGLDDFVVEPAPQQQWQGQQLAVNAAAGSNATVLLPLETQHMLDDMPALPLAGTEGLSGSEALYAGSTAADLSLYLGDDDGDDPAAAADSSGDQDMAAMSEDDMEHTEDTDADEDEGDGSNEQHDDFSSSEEAAGSDGSEVEEPCSECAGSDEEQQQSYEDMATPEPLHFEEEEEVDGSQWEGQQQDVVAAVKQLKGLLNKGNKSKRRAAGGFIDAEADLSDDEGRVEDGESDDEDDEDADGLLADLIADVKEGRFDEAKRAALHARWADGQEAREIQELLGALKHGFRRKRRHAAGLEDNDEDGTDIAAKRRRAHLLGTLADDDDDIHEGDAAGLGGSERLQRLDFQWIEQKEDVAAAAAAAAAENAARHKRQRVQQLQHEAAAALQQEADAVHLLEMEVDEGSRHTAALLRKSLSAAAAAFAAQALDRAASAAATAAIGSLSGGTVAAGAGAVGSTSSRASNGAAAAGFSFHMFGNANSTSSKPQQVAGSFIGRQASTSVAVRAASNYGASRSFVFGSDPSNHSILAATAPGQAEGKAGAAAVGPSSFAGLSKLIAEAGSGSKSTSRLQYYGSGAALSAAGGAVNGSEGGGGLLGLLHNKPSGSEMASAAGSLKLHIDAVATKFKAADAKPGDKDWITSKSPLWQF